MEEKTGLQALKLISLCLLQPFAHPPPHSVPLKETGFSKTDEWAVHLNRGLAVWSRRRAAGWLSLGASLEVSIYTAVHNRHVCQKPETSWDRGIEAHACNLTS